MTQAPHVINPASVGKVAVLMGGWSSEREVSLKSGRAVHAALTNMGVDAVAVDVVRETIVDDLKNTSFDCAFNILHGPGGEDGVIQGALDTLGLPYTGSGVAGSSLGMDKYRCKLLWKGLGLPTPPFTLIREESDLAEAEALGFPLMIKPVHEGSSIGMARVEDADALRRAWLGAAEYDTEVMAERWIDGPEYTASVVDDRVLPLIRIETPHTFYDYSAKYQADSTGYHCPCGLDEARESELKDLAARAFRAVGASGWGRVDLMLDGEGNPYLLEVNTVPGMTSHSLVPMAARAEGMDFDELVWRILAASMEVER